MIRLLACLLLSSVAIGVAHADEPTSKDAVFRRANEAYFHGKYDDAIVGYEQVVALGVRAEDLYFNLGNAYAKAGKLGPAIYNYERALILDPSQEDVGFNLKAARDAARQKGEDRLVGAELSTRWIRLVEPYTVSTLSWTFLSLWLALFGILIALHFVQPGFLRVGLQASLAFVLLGTLASGILLGGRLYLAERVEQAVVLPDSVQVREGPDANYTSSFAVHAGLKILITEKDQDWLRVRLANGLEGWLREQDLGRL